MRVCRIPRAKCARYITDGFSIPQIAAAQGWSTGTVERHLRGLGLSRSRVIVTLADVLAVVHGRETVRQVAERLGVSRPAVYQKARRDGFQIHQVRSARYRQPDLFERAA